MANDILTVGYEQFESLKDLTKPDSYEGRVYALECDNLVKVGGCKDISKRVDTLCRQIGDYGGRKIGKLAFTPLHTNYRANEHLAHSTLNEWRVGNTELFDTTLEQATRTLEKLNLLHESDRLDREATEGAERLEDLVAGLFKGASTHHHECMNDITLSLMMLEYAYTTDRYINDVDIVASLVHYWDAQLCFWGQAKEILAKRKTYRTVDSDYVGEVVDSNLEEVFKTFPRMLRLFDDNHREDLVGAVYYLEDVLGKEMGGNE